MKFIFRLIFISLGAFLLGSFMPWWSLMLVSALVSYFMFGSSINVFLSGFLGAGLLWMIAAWKVDIENASIISSKIVQLFPFEDTFSLVILAGVVGGFSGGFAALTGNAVRVFFVKKKKQSFYS